MAPRFLTILTGSDLPKIRQPGEAEPSTINEKTIADFTRVVEQTGILTPAASGPRLIRQLRLKPWRADLVARRLGEAAAEAYRRDVSALGDRGDHAVAIMQVQRHDPN